MSLSFAPTPLANPRITQIAIAAPDQVLDQQTIFDKIYRASFGDVPRAEEIFCNAGVKTRHVFYDASTVENGDLILTGKRMQLWKDGAMMLGRRTVGALLDNRDPARIGSFVMVSSTGYDAPSPDILLAKEFKLSPRLRRTFIGHMGCQAAFNGLKVGLDALAARPHEDVLLNCTEISSVHFRSSENTIEQVICQALFGDASAAVLLSRDPSSQGPEILALHTESIYERCDQLTLALGDYGLHMGLSPLVPFSIANAIAGFTERLLAPLKMRTSDIQHWGIHPGGKKIIELVANALSLKEEHTHTSLGILADYGNCASPTILMVLDRMLQREQPQPGSIGVLLGFGPGLTIEGMVLRF